MKKNLTLISLMLGVMLLAGLSAVSAGIDVTDVTLDGGSSVVVQAGDTPETEVTVHTWGTFDNWESTAYMIEGTGWTCVNTPNHYNDGIHSESFTITIPSLIAGDYDFAVRAYQYGNDCSGNYDSYTLSDAILVEEEPSCIAVVSSPVSGWYNGPLSIEWSYVGDCTLEPDQAVNLGQNGILQYLIKGFTDTSTRSMTWNTPEEGEDFSICLDTELSGSSSEAEGCSEEFGVDLTPPVVHANGPYACDEGETIYLWTSGSKNPSYENNTYDALSGIAGIEWFVNGVSVGHDWDQAYTCLDGDDTLDVQLVATDNAGNSASDDSEIVVSNVDPWNCQISGPTDTALGFETSFTGSATDVAADQPTLSYHWDFGDGNSYDNGNSFNHTYASADVYTVTLTVTDKDEGSVSCSAMIDVVDPTDLANQEVAAYYPLIASFGEDAGSYSGTWNQRGSFLTGLEGMSHTDCDVLVGPIKSASLNDGECTVVWDNDAQVGHTQSANPTNDEQGVHHVIIRAENDTGAYAYFEFDVTVYSWIIDLEEGWNLISIPYVPADTSKEIVLANIHDELGKIWSYEYDKETDSSSWIAARPHSADDGWYGGSTYKLNDIVPGRGYWVYMNEAAKLKGFGTQIAQSSDYSAPGQIPEVEVPTGSWSLIGRYGILGQTAYHYPGQTAWDAGAISKATALESLGQSWWSNSQVNEVTDDAHLNEVYNLFNNEGYWLWINEDEATVNSRTYTPLDNYYKEDLVQQIA